MLNLLREHRRFFLGLTLAGLALRLFFFFHFPQITDDSRVYADVAANWLQHGIYGQTQSSHPELPIVPIDARLPGYPAFLAVIFWLFGPGNFKAVILAQILIDLGTCLLVADLTRRMVSGRAARIAFVLATLCPFLANYAAAELTETLEIFFTALALDCAVAALDRVPEIRARKFWLGSGIAIAACILLRPDGGILLAAIALYLAAFAWKHRRHRESFRGTLGAGIVVALIALAPLIPWTIRNFRTLHHFQPLAPRYANDADELVPRGFNRWVRTWMADYVSVQEIYWNVSGSNIDPQKLPSRAFENAAQKEATLAVIADYNDGQDMTPDLDARFAAIAADRIRAHPVRYYVTLPALRIADMWLRPRTELLPPDPRWWEFDDEPVQSVVAVSFGLLNLAYIAFALAALLSGVREIRWVGLLIVFLLLRSAFLGTLENPEPRYTLECYPAIFVLGAAWLSRFARRSPA